MDFGEASTQPRPTTRRLYSPPGITPAFRLDEGFSEDVTSQDESGQLLSAASRSGFEEWVMTQSEEARAGTFAHPKRCNDYPALPVSR